MTVYKKPFIEEVLPDFYRVEIPLPDNPLRSINSYMIKSPERNLIIDTGMNRTVCFNTISSAINDLEIDLNQTDFFITHLHFDHIGLVNRLISPHSKCYFNGPESDESHIFTLTDWANRATDLASLHGFHEIWIKEIKAEIVIEEELHHFTYPEFTIIKEGDVITIGEYSFQCIETPGHSIGHLCLYEAEHKVLVSGDHVLGDISPNISSRLNEEDPLMEYLASLDKISGLDVALCLPGHRGIIRDFRGRINELKQHHEERLNEILNILNTLNQNTYQIASQMKWDMSYETMNDFPVFQKWFAFSEALSHLRYLESLDKVIRITCPDKHIVYCKNN
jgi:glyoxylase-like metal-dependent hydrolase (beta-lactamase superfamily II)